MSADIRIVRIDQIDANPWRNLATYPPIRRKVDSLKNSISAVGMWESIIVRPNPLRPGRYQQAFGHQRIYAGREMGIETIPVIVRDLTDEQMLQFMGRENGEDYSTDFLVMLNTYEAGHDYLFALRKEKPQPVAIARLLGWTRIQHATGKADIEVMDDIAVACSGASKLLEAGHNKRTDFEDLSVRVARDIVTRAVSSLTTIENIGKAQKAPAKEIEKAKHMVGHGVRETARDIRRGTLAPSQVRSAVDINTMRAAGKEKVKPEILFAAFGDKLAETIAKTLRFDPIAEKLVEIVKVIDYVSDSRDKAILRSLDFELGELATRAGEWRTRISPDKVKPFPTAAQIGGPNP